MIKFSDTKESPASTGLPEVSAFKEITPSDNEGVGDACAFWDTVFSAPTEADELQSADFESLIPDVFGWYEEEFDFDFEIDEGLSRILRRFDETKWDNASDAEKEEAISDLAVAIGKRLGLYDIPAIRYFDGPEGSCGAYIPDKNIIEINRNNFSSPIEIVDTVAHETRHAYQQQRAQNPETYMDVLYGVNFENYISPVQLENGHYLFFTDYQDQLVEAEARAFANLFKDMEGM